MDYLMAFKKYLLHNIWVNFLTKKKKKGDPYFEMADKLFTTPIIINCCKIRLFIVWQSSGGNPQNLRPH